MTELALRVDEVIFFSQKHFCTWLAGDSVTLIHAETVYELRVSSIFPEDKKFLSDLNTKSHVLCLR